MPNRICRACAMLSESVEPPVCEDERQYAPDEAQRWTTLDELRGAHRADVRDVEPGLAGIGMEPSFAIG
jgi:hypothetical protein